MQKTLLNIDFHTYLHFVRELFNYYNFYIGHEYQAIVEFAPNQKIPRKSRSHKDGKNGTIDEDPDYLRFLEYLENPVKTTRTIQQCLEDIDAKEKELKSMYMPYHHILFNDMQLDK